MGNTSVDELGYFNLPGESNFFEKMYWIFQSPFFNLFLPHFLHVSLFFPLWLQNFRIMNAFLPKKRVFFFLLV